MDTIHIPERIEKKIGRSGWSALSWALCNDWVANYKWLFSEIAGFDLSTPCTVQIMLILGGLMSRTNTFFLFSEELERHNFHKVGTRGLFMLSDRIEPHQVPAFYELLTEGYLLGTDFVSYIHKTEDQQGKNQLEGELRRFCQANQDKGKDALTSIAQDPSLPITKEVVSEFCQFAFLHDSFYPFCKALDINIGN